MSAYRRNLAVGVTVLVALVALGWMLLKFGSAPVKLFEHDVELNIHFVADRADGLVEGSQIFYLGVPAGRITSLRRSNDQRDVLIDSAIAANQKLPGNLRAIIRTQGLLSGAAAMSLELTGPAPASPTGQLADGQTIIATYVGSDLIPQQFAELAAELEKTTHDVRDARLVAHLDETVRSASDTLKALHEYVADPKLKADIQTAMSNFRDVTEKADRAAGNVEKFSDRLEKVGDQATAILADAQTTVHKTQEDVDQLDHQLNDRMAQISKLLDSVQSIATKVDVGKGTAGMLVNDPKLYQSLVDSSRDLNLTISDLKRLLEQWEQEGMSLKLK